jgi:cytochrome c553
VGLHDLGPGSRPHPAAALAIGAVVLTSSLGAAAPAPVRGPMQTPLWAYAISPPIPPGVRPAPNPKRDDPTLMSLPGSQRRYTWAQVHDEFAPKSPPGVADWYPGDHPPMPPIVARGDAARKIRACGYCHQPEGGGRPENAPLAGLPPAYFVQQLKDMRSGRRTSAEPRKGNARLMEGYAKAMTEAEMETAARYFARSGRPSRLRVIETHVVPKTRPVVMMYQPLEGREAGRERLGRRLIETPADPLRVEDYRDPRQTYLVYAPPGSVAQGRTAVASGARGRSTPCATCHGAGLTGMDAAPPIAGRSPSYLARQLNDFRRRARRGPNAALMIDAAARLTDDDILVITAYLATLPPTARGRR